MGIANKVLLDTCKEYGLNDKQLGKEAQNALLEYEFPGNIRELISIVQRACILSEEDTISKEDLFLEARSAKKELKNLEKELLEESLKNMDYDVEKTAEFLGMELKSLKEKMKKYHIKG